MINFVNVSLILGNRRKYSAFCACEPLCVCVCVCVCVCEERETETERALVHT